MDAKRYNNVVTKLEFNLRNGDKRRKTLVIKDMAVLGSNVGWVLRKYMEA